MGTIKPHKAYHISFLEKLAEGKIYEQIAIDKITKKYDVELIEWLDNSDYDFKTSDGKTYEVKADLKSAKTTNFFIEYRGFEKPTGISITKATYYIITDGKHYYKIKTKKIRGLLDDNKYSSFTLNDISNTKGWIVPKVDIINLAREI
jgi:hypothetical protein